MSRFVSCMNDSLLVVIWPVSDIISMSLGCQISLCGVQLICTFMKPHLQEKKKYKCSMIRMILMEYTSVRIQLDPQNVF